jgi:hypothetical protein
VSRAFVKEDGPEGPPRVYSLPARDDAAFPLAAARALLSGADQGDTAGAESATGYYWGDPVLGGPVRQLLLEAEDRGDDRTAQLARRYLRRAGLNPEE